MHSELVPLTTADALARGRLTVIKHAHDLLETDSGGSVPPDALPRVVGLLTTTLEELKVAEEELQEQNERLLARQAIEERERRHYSELFMQLPVPALFTDPFATVLECNRSAANLFKRDASHLSRKPLSALLHVAAREQFRREIQGLRSIDGSTRMSLVLHPKGELPFRAMATVARFDDCAGDGALRFLWVFDPIPATEGND
jgi:PAS domain-containing protein